MVVCSNSVQRLMVWVDIAPEIRLSIHHCSFTRSARFRRRPSPVTVSTFRRRCPVNVAEAVYLRSWAVDYAHTIVYTMQSLIGTSRGWGGTNMYVGDEESLNIAEEASGRHADRTRPAFASATSSAARPRRTPSPNSRRAANRVSKSPGRTHRKRATASARCVPDAARTLRRRLRHVQAGRIYLPLAPVFGPDALNYRLEDSGAAALFTTTEGCGGGRWRPAGTRARGRTRRR